MRLQRKVFWVKIMKAEEFRKYLLNRGKAKNTVRAYCYAIAKMTKELGEMENLPYNAFRNYRDFLIKSGNKESTINYKFEVVRSYLYFLINEYGIMPETFVNNKIKLPFRTVMETASIYYEKELTINEVKKILKEAKGRSLRDYLLLFFIVSTGTRVSEALQLKISDLDKKRVEVRSKGKSRYILIPSAFVKEAKPYIAKNKNQYMFPGRMDKPMTTRRALDIMKFYCQKAKIPENKRFIHNLRHTYTITELEANTDIHEIAQKLGHSTTKTLEKYSKRNERNMRAKVNETANKFRV